MRCCNRHYQDFCGHIYKYAPACEAINSKDAVNAACSLRNQSDTGLVVRFFDSGREIVDKNKMVFHPQGICMYPCIRPGDRLHIESRSIEQVKIGDIAVYRRFNRLFAHRVIGAGEKLGAHYIITRPDTAPRGDDGPTFDEDILGVVVRLERKGKILGIVRKTYPLLHRILLDIHVLPYRLAGQLWAWLSFHLSLIQQYSFYRVFAQYLFMNKKVEFSLQVPINARPDSRLFQKLSREGLLDRLSAEEPVAKWSLHVAVKARSVGYVSFVRKPESCLHRGWWVYEAHIDPLYRGTAVETRLLQEVVLILGRAGIKAVSVTAFGDAIKDRLFFKNMGFNEVSSYRDVLLKGQCYGAVERVIMKMYIC